MARYIDADKFIERLKASPAFPNMGMDGYFFLDVVENLLKKFPTADVAPKSEVDLYRKQVDELEDELASTYDKLENAKNEVAREIIDDIEMYVLGIKSGKEIIEKTTPRIYRLKRKDYMEAVLEYLAELKKK